MDDQQQDDDSIDTLSCHESENEGENNPDKGSLYERGKQFLTNKLSKINKEREKLENQGSTECTFQPNISKKSKSLTREESLYEYNNKWVCSCS